MSLPPAPSLSPHPGVNLTGEFLVLPSLSCWSFHHSPLFQEEPGGGSGLNQHRKEAGPEHREGVTIITAGWLISHNPL